MFSVCVCMSSPVSLPLGGDYVPCEAGTLSAGP